MDKPLEKPTVLIVDDIEINREILHEILCGDYDTIKASNGREAIKAVVANEKINCILLDLMMPDISGFDVMEILRSSGHIPRIPVIIITANSDDANEIKGLKMGAVDFLGKPFNPDVVLCRVAAQVELNLYRHKLEELVDRKTQRILNMRDSMLEIMANIIEHRHIESGQHVKRTKVMAERLFELLRDSGKFAEQFHNVKIEDAVKAVPLHDIGKIGIPDNVLLKPGRLTPEEFEIIKQHTVIGNGIITELEELYKDEGSDAKKYEDYIRYCREICLFHHERWDGNGYPHRLKGNEIPLTARVMSIVDVYDALTSKRVYKPAMTHEEAMAEIVKNAGTQFDPEMIRIFDENNEDFDEIFKSYSDPELENQVQL